MVMVFVTKLIT